MADRGLLGPGNVPIILGSKTVRTETKGIGEQRGPILKIMKDESALKGRAGPIGSLKIIGDKWEHTGEKVSQFLSESNVDYQVIGILGGPAVGKSTILNALYGLAADHPSIAAGRTPPPFPVQSDETRMLARHSSSGVEMRLTAERLILLDSQPLFSPSVLTDITRPDGSSSLGLLPGQHLTAEHALELMALQQAVFLFSVCHVVLVVSEGLADTRLWELVHTVQLLHERTFRPLNAFAPPLTPTSSARRLEPVASQARGQPLRAPGEERPGSASSTQSGTAQPGQQGRPLSRPGTSSSQAESRPGTASSGEQRRPGSASSARPPDGVGNDFRKGPQARIHCPEVVFVHTKLKGCDLLTSRLQTAQNELSAFLPPSVVPHTGAVTYFPRVNVKDPMSNQNGNVLSVEEGRDRNGQVAGRTESQQKDDSTGRSGDAASEGPGVSFFALPAKGANSAAFESFPLSLRMLRDQVLGVPRKHILGKPMTEATWLRYTTKVWKDVRESESIREYSLMLQTSGFFR